MEKKRAFYLTQFILPIIQMMAGQYCRQPLMSFRPYKALCRNLGVNHADGGQVGGIACAAQTNAPPRNFLISLNLQKVALIWVGN